MTPPTGAPPHITFHGKGSWHMANADDYSKFDSASYLRTRYPSPEAGRSPFSLQCFHDFVQKYKNQWDGTAKFLEVGGGPNIMTLISIAPYVSEIIFSEYAAECRKSVQLWKTGSLGAYDLSPFMHYVVSKLEGNPDPDGAKAREDLIRSKVRVVSCDMLADGQSILEDEAATNTQFDIVSTTGCIEACVDSEDQYSDCLVKLKHFLTPKGFLIGTAIFGVTWWNVEGVVYRGFPLSKDGFLTALQKAGFMLLEQKVDTTKAPSLSNIAGVMFYVAKAV